jgi:hypothetical protein
MATGLPDREGGVSRFCLMALFLFCLLPAGCGRKGPPVPPGTLRPEEIRDLSFQVVAKGVILKWSVPLRHHDGSPLSYIKEFRLYRAETPIDGGCLECPPRYGKPTIIRVDSRPESGKEIVYQDTTVRPGFLYTYRVRTVKGLLNVSDLSNKVSLAWHSPPGRPLNLSATVSANGVRLSWLPPERFQDGSPISGHLSYKIFRRFEDEKSWTELPWSVKKNEFFDDIRRTYRQVEYKVAPVFYYHDTEIIGEASSPLLVRARGFGSVEPPKAVGLTVVPKGVALSWDRASRADIVGYYVYRRDPNGLIFRLNNYPVKENRFIDITRLKHGTYRYWVTAVDDSYPPNESPPSRVVSIRK